MDSVGPPAGPADGVTDPTRIVGKGVDGLEMVKGREADVPIEFVTVTAAVPGNATFVAGTEAVSSVALTKVVGCAVPFQSTIASLVKFVPVTVSVKPCVLQYGVEAAEVVDAESEVIAGAGPGAAPIVKRTTLDTSVVVVLLTFVAD